MNPTEWAEPAEANDPIAGDVAGDVTGDDAFETIALGAVEESALPRPRVRWAGVVWGLAFAAAALWGLITVSTAGGRAAAADWAAALTPATGIAYALLAIGVIAVLTALAGLLRRAQAALGRRA